MLVGNNIILCSLNIEDLDLFLKWKNDPDIKKNAMLHPFPVTKELEKNWFENKLNSKNNSIINFTIKLKNNKSIGYVTISQINYINRNCKFGIIIGDKSVQGKGYGKEVIDLVKKYCFEALGLVKISLEVAESNQVAKKLYEKCGFEQEGILKKHFYVDGNFMDVFLMSCFLK